MLRNSAECREIFVVKDEVHADVYEDKCLILEEVSQQEIVAIIKKPSSVV